MAGQRTRCLAVLLLAALCYFSAPAFVAAPQIANSEASHVVTVQQRGSPEGLAAGLAAGLLTAQPAYAGGIFWDEIFPYSVSISFAIIWGIILGFVLLRLQEAFPE
eukprot:symbB.v1.2.005805.t1/scaffold341.1/size224985/8